MTSKSFTQRVSEQNITLFKFKLRPYIDGLSAHGTSIGLGICDQIKLMDGNFWAPNRETANTSPYNLLTQCVISKDQGGVLHAR